MAQAPWLKYGGAPVTPQATPGYIPGVPDQPTQLELNRDRRADDTAARQARALEITADNSQRALANDQQRDRRTAFTDNFNQSTKLADDYARDPAVKAYAQAVPSYAAALTSNATPQGDLNLIYAFAKVLDPDSVVREGEAASVANSDTIYGRTVARLQKELGEGGTFSETAREGLRRELRVRMSALNQAYLSSRNNYKDRAERFGLDPINVVGEHAGRSFQDEEAKFLGRPVQEGDYRGNPAAPIAPGATPNPTSGPQRPQGAIEFGNTGGAPVGAEAYQQEIETGIRNGTITNADQVAAVAAKYRYAAPDRAETEKMFEALRNGARYGGAQAPVYASVQAAQEQMKQERGDSIVDPFVRGVADTATLGLADEIAGIGNAIVTGGSVDENIALERARDNFDEQRNFLPRLGGQIAGGFALPVPASANTPLRLAGVGAGYGAGYGFGSADGGLADRLAGAAVGGATGGAIGYAGGSLAQRLANRTPPTTPRGVNQDVVNAADRQGVELVRPDVAPGSRNTYGFLESLPFSGGRVRNDLQRGVDQIEQRVADVGQTASAVPRQTAGENLQAAGERYVDRSRSVVSRLYDRAATLSGNSQVTPTQALSTIDNHIAQLSETPSANATKLGILNQLRADLVDQSGNVRPLSIQAIRDLRTAMRDELGTKGLRYTDTERRITDAIDSASNDIASQLSGPALRAFQRADRAYRERVDLVDNVVERFIGNSRTAPRSGEQVMSAVERAAKPGAGDAASLERLMTRLQPNERQEVASTIAARLGRAADDAEFSPATFFSQIKTYSPEARAAIFGKQGAADLADLQRIAQARTGTMGRLNNTRSGVVGNWFNTIQSVLAGGGAGALVGGATGFGAAAGSGVGVVAAPIVAGGAYVTARALGNRRVVSALAQAARAQTPQARTQAISYLTTIANREPALTAEILPIRDALQAALSQAPGRAAANQEQQ